MPTKKEPKVSVIIPVYNTGVPATRLIRSLLSQPYQNLEIIAVNDGSIDDSLARLRAVKEPRLKVYSQPNAGASSARNLGIKKATGKYLLFIDSDDEIKPSFITRLVEQIKKPDTSLAATGIQFHRVASDIKNDFYLSSPPPQSSNETKKAFILRLLYTDGRLNPAFNKIFHAEIIKKHHILFSEKMIYGEDTKFVLDYLGHAPGQIRFIHEALYVYYYGTTTSIAKHAATSWRNWSKCIANLKSWLGPKPNRQEKFRFYRVACHWRFAWFKARIRALLAF